MGELGFNPRQPGSRAHALIPQAIIILAWGLFAVCFLCTTLWPAKLFPHILTPLPHLVIIILACGLSNNNSYPWLRVCFCKTGTHHVTWVYPSMLHTFSRLIFTTTLWVNYKEQRSKNTERLSDLALDYRAYVGWIQAYLGSKLSSCPCVILQPVRSVLFKPLI